MRREIEARLGLRPSTSTACPRSWGRASPANASAQAGLHGWEDHFLFEVIDPETGRAAAGGRGRRARDHHADQGGAADAALPHARHHAPHDARPATAAARTCASCASPAQRRHADHPRRQRLPVADRGRAGRPAAHRAALPARRRAPGQPRPRARRGRGAARRRAGAVRAHRPRCRAPHQIDGRHHDRRRGKEPGRRSRARKARRCACATCGRKGH